MTCEQDIQSVAIVAPETDDRAPVSNRSAVVTCEQDVQSVAIVAPETDASRLKHLWHCMLHKNHHAFAATLNSITDKTILGNLFADACSNGCDDFVRMMLDFGVNVDIRDEVHKSTGLMFAAQRSRLSTVNLLLLRGANVLLRSFTGSYRDAFSFASAGDTLMLYVLSEAIKIKVHSTEAATATDTQDVVLRNIESKSDESKFVLLKCFLSMGDIQNFTAMFNSIKNKTILGQHMFNKLHDKVQLDFMKVVIDDCTGQDDTYKLFVLNRLLSLNDLPNFKIVLHSVQDKTILAGIFTSACTYGSAGLVTLLLDSGVNVDTRDNVYGSTGLMFAAQSNRESTVRVLLERGADMSLCSTKVNNQTARQFAGSNSVRKILDDFEKTRTELLQKATMSVPEGATMSVPQGATDGHVKESQNCATQEEVKLANVTETEVRAPEDQGQCRPQEIALKTMPTGDEILIFDNGSTIYFKKFGTAKFIAL